MLNRILKVVVAVTGSAFVASLLAKWPVAVTVVSAGGAVASALLHESPIDHNVDNNP